MNQPKKEVLDLSNSDYHAIKSHISASGVKQLLKNPYEFLHPAEVDEKKQKAFDFGSLVHTLILEPEMFEKEYAVEEFEGCELNKNTKAYKEAKAKFLEENKGKTIISKADYEKAAKMTANTMIVPELRNLFELDGIAECSYFGEIDGVKTKCRPDYYIEEMGIVVDVKTTNDASPDGFAKACADFGYHVQASFYLQTLQSIGKKAERFLFVAIEKTEPYMVGLYELDAEALLLGEMRIKEAFRILEHIEDFDKPFYKDKFDEETVIKTISLPKWAFYEE